MVLEVIEHVVRRHRLAAIANGACWLGVAFWVDGPYGKERGQALTDCHRRDVVLEPWGLYQAENQRKPRAVRGKLRANPAALRGRGKLQRATVESKRKHGSGHYRPPTGHSG